MRDARWFEVDEDVAAAVEHFGRSVELFAEGGFESGELSGYKARMALMHAMQSGHTSMEAALIRTLKLLGEETPAGNDWHADLIRRVSRDVGGRPAILTPELAKAAGETRRFRHVAMKSYGSFDAELSRPAVLAAGFIVRHLPSAVSVFKAVIDPAPSAHAERPSSPVPRPDEDLRAPPPDDLPKPK